MKRMLLGGALAVWCSAESGSAQSDVPRAPRPVVQNIADSGGDPLLILPQASDSTAVIIGGPDDLRPPPRPVRLPQTRWQHMQGHAIWTQAALSALKGHGRPLVDLVPADIANWCPAYPTATADQRASFWVGFMSALAKYESTYKPRAVGGGGRWFGLLQILPATARGYNCRVGTGEALKDGAANLSCAIRIMAVTVPRDGVIYGRGGRGVAADWGPMRSESKRRDMSAWLRKQKYWTRVGAIRPKGRPE
jgi:hypothetical protein